MIIKANIDRFEENKAILKTEDGITVIWPKNKLPLDSREGSSLTISIQNEQDEEKNRRQAAQDILNEILNV